MTPFDTSLVDRAREAKRAQREEERQATLSQLLRWLSSLNENLDQCIEAVHMALRPDDVRHSLADISAARQGIGYEPVVDFRQGVARTVAWFRETPQAE